MIHLRAGVNALAVLAVAARAKMTEAMNFMVRKGCFVVVVGVEGVGYLWVIPLSTQGW